MSDTPSPSEASKTDPLSGQPLPWRKRHPVLSRVVLYTLGAAIIGVGLGLLLERRRVDAADHAVYLHSLLDGFDLTIGTPGGRQIILDTLAEEYARRDIPPDVYQRVLRVRAQIEAREGETEHALALLEEAEGIAGTDEIRRATRVERAGFLSSLGRDEEALVLIQADGEPWEPYPLELHRVMQQAISLVETDRSAEGLGLLEAALAADASGTDADLRLGMSIWNAAATRQHAGQVLEALRSDEH